MTIYRVVCYGDYYELRGPGYVMTISKPKDVADLNKWVAQAKRLSSSVEDYVAFMICEEWGM